MFRDAHMDEQEKKQYASGHDTTMGGGVKMQSFFVHSN